MDKPRLGVVRVIPLVATGAIPFIDIEYHEDDFILRLLNDVRRDGFFFNGMVFMPFNSIGAILKLPDQALKDIAEKQQAMQEAQGVAKQ